jgi:hypothetical protein
MHVVPEHTCVEPQHEQPQSGAPPAQLTATHEPLTHICPQPHAGEQLEGAHACVMAPHSLPAAHVP